ncbi:MAG: type IX secretion system membrane protein PorP/SprF [Bacteroidales bacterium]|nr:type IX secretion system membrane protein PorP/SprF [Bacteroidales bacterium]
MNKFLGHILLIVFAILFLGRINAQQLPIYSQYMMNGFLVNPAAAGLEGYTAFNFTAREHVVRV